MLRRKWKPKMDARKISFAIVSLPNTLKTQYVSARENKNRQTKRSFVLLFLSHSTVGKEINSTNWFRKDELYLSRWLFVFHFFFGFVVSVSVGCVIDRLKLATGWLAMFSTLFFRRFCYEISLNATRACFIRFILSFHVYFWVSCSIFRRYSLLLYLFHVLFSSIFSSFFWKSFSFSIRLIRSPVLFHVRCSVRKKETAKKARKEEKL